MKQKLTRYEINQKVKRILVSHGADLQQISFTCSGKSASFTGRLTRISGRALKQEEVETLCRALAGIAELTFLNFDLEDWLITSSTGNFSIAQKTIPLSGPRREDTPLVITSDETVEDVLKDS